MRKKKKQQSLLSETMHFLMFIALYISVGKRQIIDITMQGCIVHFQDFSTKKL